MRLFRISSKRNAGRTGSLPKESGAYPNFLRDIVLDQRFLMTERYGAANDDDPELTEENHEVF